MIISLDVKTVKILVNIYNAKKILSWFPLVWFVTSVARYLKKLTSSKKIERIVIDINKISICIGPILEFVKWFNNSLISTSLIVNKRIAPIKDITQYVWILNFLIWIVGNNKLDKTINAEKRANALRVEETREDEQKDEEQRIRSHRS